MGNDIGFTEEDQLLMDLLKEIDEKEEKKQVYNKVLLIRKEETFLVNTIKNNLDKNGFLFVETAMSVRELNEKKDSAELMLMYVDDTIDEARDVLVFVKDLLLEEGKELVLLGDRNEVVSVEKVIPKELITGIFERPFDMRAIMDRVGDFLIQQRMQQNKKMILIVDDDPTYLKLIKEWLKDDYRVSMANSGMQAITWLANNCADLVLLDYEMPTIKGSKVLEMLRSDAQIADTPVMFLTGKSDKQSIIDVLALKPAGYLLKSIDRKTLLETLNKFFVEQRYKK
ncbi:MAG: response regulator [Lachnospiraceae bacterium]|nr:response regulator [Lachnospiraceae bacterium]